MIFSNLTVTRKAMLALVAAAALAVPPVIAWAQTTSPATQPVRQAPNPVLATINGEPINREEFLNILNAVAGMRLFEQVKDLVLVQQAVRSAGMEITPADISAEKKRILDNLAERAGAEGQKLTDQELEGAFQQIMARQGATPIEVEFSLRRAAGLRKLASKLADINVTEEQVQEAFAAEFGPKVQIRDVIVKNMTEGSTIRSAVEKDGKSLGDLAAQKNLPQQVLIVPENVKGLPEAIRERAFNMKEGEISPVIPVETPQGSALHILLLEKKIPAQDKKLDAAMKDTIKKELREQAEVRWGNEHLQTLRRNANIHINDPILSQAYLNVAAAATRAAAATQNAATAPAK